MMMNMQHPDVPLDAHYVPVNSNRDQMILFMVHGSHAMLPTMRGYSSSCLMLGTGMLIPGSTQQNLKMHSLTVMELIALVLLCPNFYG